MTNTSTRPGGAPRLHPLALSLALAGVLAGCGGGSSDDASVQEARLPRGGAPSGATAAAGGAPGGFSQHVNHAGASLCTSTSTSWIGAAWNDRISSIRVPAGYKVELFADRNLRGTTVTLTADNANLVGLGLNDAVSSMRVTPPAAPSKVTLASVQFAQSMLYASGDSQLVLVANKH